MKREYPILVVRGGIFNDTLEDIERGVSGITEPELYMVLDSPGGDPSAGYRIMRMLQAKFKRIVAVVPAEAYSTATLMALGADVIYMRQSACLGPLDTQIEHPTEGGLISSLEIRDTITTLAGLVSTFTAGFHSDYRDGAGLGKRDALEMARNSALELVRPVAEKIDPIHLQRSTRSSKITQKYAESLLKSRTMSGKDKLAEVVSRHLANGYDYHGYAIMLDEAKSLLGLQVHDMVELEIWDQIKVIYQEVPDHSVKYIKLKFDDGQKKEDHSGNANAKIETEMTKGGGHE